MTDVVVRHAGETDSSLLADMGAATFRDTFGSQNTPENMTLYIAESFGPEKQAAEMSESGAVFLIAEVNGLPAGFAHLRTGDVPECVTANRPIEISRIYALQSWIGKGVGAALMTACLDEAHRRGCDVVWLGVWEHNAKARKFYRDWKFNEVGTQIFQLGKDLQTDVLMQRSVP